MARRRLLVGGACLLAVVAPAQGSWSGSSWESSRDDRAPVAPAPHPLVLQMWAEGGFGADPTATPLVSLYADGRIIVSGGEPNGSGREVAHLRTGTVPTAELHDVVKAAREAGAGGAGEIGPRNVDEGTLRFRMADGVLGNGACCGSASAPGEQERRLRAVATRLFELGAVARDPYAPTAVSVLVRPYDDPSIAPRAGWPSTRRTETAQPPGDGCLGFTGREAQRVLDAAAAAPPDARWRAGGSSWRLRFRPELPGVEPC